SIRRAVDEDRPVLGICRGSQLINVAQGGTLVQHIEGHRKDIGNGDMDFIDEKVELVGSTKVAALLERDTMDGCSSHHQTIDRTGDRLMIAAYVHDNSIKAIEHLDKSWFVGLQWHPEEGSANADHRQLLFEAVIRHAQRQKDQKLVLQQKADVWLRNYRECCSGAHDRMDNICTTISGDGASTVYSRIADTR